MGDAHTIEEQQRKCREEGLGALACLSDRCVLKILKRLLPKDVLVVSTVSRALYQCATWDDVWRTHCLERWNGAFTFRVSWKITTFFPDPSTSIPEALLPSPQKLQIKGFFSDDMYRRWWYATHCRDLSHWDTPWPDAAEEEDEEEDEDEETSPTSAHPQPHPPSPLPSTHRTPPFFRSIDRISASSISVELFKQRYIAANVPVILTDITPSWRSFGAPAPAPSSSSNGDGIIDTDEDGLPSHSFSSDSDDDDDGEQVEDQRTVGGTSSPYLWAPEQLAQRFEKHLFKINSYSQSGRRIKMTMKDYVSYMRTNTDAYPLYIFDSKFGERCPDMLRDFDVPPHFWEDLFAALPEDAGARPPHRWIVMGPARSGTPFHIDPNGTSAWNALLSGRKRWALYPPPPPGYPPPPGVDPKTLKAPHPLIWWSEIYPRLAENALPHMEFVQEAGDFLFVPSGWWHTVLNLCDTVAVTQNFVNMENLDAVVATMMREGRGKLVEFWKRRLMPVRPELFFRISHQQRMIMLETQASEAAEYKRRLREEKRQRRQLEAEVLRLKSLLESTQIQKPT